MMLMEFEEQLDWAAVEMDEDDDDEEELGIGKKPIVDGASDDQDYDGEDESDNSNSRNGF